MQKYSVKLVLRKNKQNQLGQCPIYIRITINRDTSFITTGHQVPEKAWDEKTERVRDTYAYHKQINTDLAKKKHDILDELVQAAVKGKPLSAEAVKQTQKEKLNNIFSFAENFKKQVANNRSKGTLKNYDKHLKKLEDFAGKDLNFENIDSDFLYKFEDHLRNGGVDNREGKDPNNYIDVIMRTIRKLFNDARKRQLITHYPFDQYEMPKISGGNKPYLTLEELDQWHRFTFETEHPVYKEVALYFLFGCYTGLRLSDWREFVEAKIKERNISLQATKNKAWIAVPLHDRLISTIQEMKKIPLTLVEPTINRNLKVIAKYLKINKKLSTHSGRKTFAVTVCLERGVSAETTAKLMGITLAVFEKNYSFITPDKIQLETAKAWAAL